MELEKLKQIIAEVLSVDPREVTEDTSFVDDLCADSLDVYQIVMGIEETFDIEVDPDAAAQIETVKEAVELIKNTRSERKNMTVKAGAYPQLLCKRAADQQVKGLRASGIFRGCGAGADFQRLFIP